MIVWILFFLESRPGRREGVTWADLTKFFFVSDDTSRRVDNADIMHDDRFAELATFIKNNMPDPLDKQALSKAKFLRLAREGDKKLKLGFDPKSEKHVWALKRDYGRLVGKQFRFAKKNDSLSSSSSHGSGDPSDVAGDESSVTSDREPVAPVAKKRKKQKPSLIPRRVPSADETETDLVKQSPKRKTMILPSSSKKSVLNTPSMSKGVMASRVLVRFTPSVKPAEAKLFFVPFDPSVESHRVFENVFMDSVCSHMMLAAIEYVERESRKEGIHDDGWRGIQNDQFYDPETGKLQMAKDAQIDELSRLSPRRYLPLGDFVFKAIKYDIIADLIKLGVIPPEFITGDIDTSIIAIKTTGPCPTQFPHTDFDTTKRGQPTAQDAFSIIFGLTESGVTLMVHEHPSDDIRPETLNSRLSASIRGLIAFAGWCVHAGDAWNGSESLRIHIYLARNVPASKVVPSNKIYVMPQSEVTAQQYIDHKRRSK